MPRTGALSTQALECAVSDPTVGETAPSTARSGRAIPATLASSCFTPRRHLVQSVLRLSQIGRPPRGGSEARGGRGRRVLCSRPRRRPWAPLPAAPGRTPPVPPAPCRTLQAPAVCSRDPGERAWVGGAHRHTGYGARTTRPAAGRAHDNAQGLGPGQTPATRAQREGARAGAVPAACRCLTSDNYELPRPPRRQPPRATAVRADPSAPRLVPPAPALSRVQAQHLQRDSGCPAPSAMRGRF